MKNDAELGTSRHDVKPASSLLNLVSCVGLFGLSLMLLNKVEMHDFPVTFFDGLLLELVPKENKNWVSVVVLAGCSSLFTTYCYFDVVMTQTALVHQLWSFQIQDESRSRDPPMSR